MKKAIAYLSTPERLLFFSIGAFVYIAGISLSILKTPSAKVLVASSAQREYHLAPLPVLDEEAQVPLVSAQGALMVDLNSGVTLYEKDSEKALLPASTTKIMTALVSLEVYQAEDVLTVPLGSVIGQKMRLFAGERMTARSLLDGLLIFSANDAAETLAANYPGGREVFIARMNEKAKEMGLKNTHYANPTGLDEQNHYSTARDMVWLSASAMRNPTFAEIVSTKTKTVYNIEKTNAHYLWNINELLGVVPGLKGVKTGWTEEARENLVSYVERKEGVVVLAIMGSQDRFGETRELVEWAYSNYKWVQVDAPKFQPKFTYSP